MARPGISKHEVFAAATELVGRGTEPTIEQVRGILGTGSNSTIAHFLREWRALRAKGDSVSLDEGLPHEFIGLMKGLWQRVLKEADSQINIIRQDSEQTLAESKKALDAVKHDHAQLETQYHHLKVEKNSLEQEKITLEEVLLEKHQSIISLNEKQNGLATQLDEKQQLIDELRALHKQTQHNLEHYREQTRAERVLNDERHAREREQLKETIKAAQQRLVIAQQDKIKFEQHADKISHEKALLQANHEAMEEKFNKLQQYSQKLENERDEHALSFKNERELHAILQKKFDEQTAIFIELQKQVAVFSQQLNDARAEVNALKEQNNLLSLEKWELAQEKAQLVGETKQLRTMIHLKEAN